MPSYHFMSNKPNQYFMKKLSLFILLFAISLWSLQAQEKSRQDFDLELVDEKGQELSEKFTFTDGDGSSPSIFVPSNFTVKVIVKSKKQKLKLDIQEMQIKVFSGGKAIDTKIQKNNSLIDLSKFSLKSGDGIQVKVINVKQTSPKGKTKLVKLSKPFISFNIFDRD